MRSWLICAPWQCSQRCNVMKRCTPAADSTVCQSRSTTPHRAGSSLLRMLRQTEAVRTLKHQRKNTTQRPQISHASVELTSALILQQPCTQADLDRKSTSARMWSSSAAGSDNRVGLLRAGMAVEADLTVY